MSELHDKFLNHINVQKEALTAQLKKDQEVLKTIKEAEEKQYQLDKKVEEFKVKYYKKPLRKILNKGSGLEYSLKKRI